MKTIGIKQGIYLCTTSDRAFIIWINDEGNWQAQEIQHGNSEGLFYSPVAGEAPTLKAAKEMALSS